MNLKTLSTLTASLLTATIFSFSAGVHAAVDQHEQATTTPALKLNAGKKWATDEPLRQGLTRIRESAASTLSTLQIAKSATTPYDTLAKEIDRQVAYIVKNCKLEPQADEALHVILSDLIQSNDALQGKSEHIKRSAGMVKLVGTLETYGNYFDHPGWDAPKSGQ